MIKLNKLKRIAHQWMCMLVGYKVTVVWEDKTVVHWSMTMADACDWMVCYAGVGARVTITAA